MERCLDGVVYVRISLFILNLPKLRPLCFVIALLPSFVKISCMVAHFSFLIPHDSPSNTYSVFINYFSGSIPASAIQKDILTYDRSVIGMILMIPKATSSDAGTYRCTVRNQLGSDSRSFRVTLS